ncbi:MAG TPA: hypothetical protein VGF92_11705 [Stellaceae bacterium]|jgi:hypothetical protein
MATRERDLGRGEPPAVNARSVVATMAAALMLLVLSAVGLALFFSDRIGMTFVDRQPFPAPGVSASERTTRALLERKEAAALAGADGRMPIDTAMQKIVARGAHAFDPVASAP